MAERIVVVGGGTMGAGIAFVAARAGFDVQIVEPVEGARARALPGLAREAERSSDSEALDRIAWLHEIPARSDAILAIEAVPERIDVKRSVLTALAESLAPDALLATNTSSLSVAELAEGIAHPQRILGLHFFNPPARMALVEVVEAPQTSADALDVALLYVERFGKTGVLVNDTPGFVVNRVARPYYLQALHALQSDAASVEELDALARSLGFRMGPFELMDLIGLDVNLTTSESIYERTEAARLEPVALQRSMVAEGRLGRKTGEGFYRYRNGQMERFELTAPAPADAANDEEILGFVGFDERAHDFAERLRAQYSNLVHLESDEMLDEIPLDATILIDAGDGVSDRGEILARLDADFGPETIILTDAYATNLAACARRLRHPERLIGYGVLGALDDQSAVEIVNSETASDDALALAQELFASIGKAAVLIEDVPGLFLGRVVGSIVNEAMIAVAEEVATPEDVDTAMQLGANYPRGPIAWGRGIGGARLRRILKRLADVEGEQFAAHRSLWVLDVAETEQTPEIPQ